MIIFFLYCWSFSSLVTTKKLTKTSTFSIPITIPTYQHQHTTYHIPTYHIPTYHIHITYPYPHTMYHVPHITTNISTYHISHSTHPHTNISHSTYHIPYTTIYLTPCYLYYLGFFYCPNFFVCQYSIILPKIYIIIRIQNYFVKLKSPN